MRAITILPLAAMLLAAPAHAGGIVCPSPEPLMLHLCGAAEHSSKMYAAIHAGDQATMQVEADLAANEMDAYTKIVIAIVDQVNKVRAEILRKASTQ
jgi:hypothetical protein